MSGSRFRGFAGPLVAGVLLVLASSCSATQPSAVTRATPETTGVAARLIDPVITVMPATGLHDGQQVQVTMTGFGEDGKVWLSECATAADASAAGCGQQLATQPFFGTDENRSASGPFTVSDTAYPHRYSLGPQTCLDQCVLVATAGFGFTYTRLSFAQ